MEAVPEPIFKNPIENFIAHSPAETLINLASPGLAILPNGTIIASHDLCGKNAPKDKYGRENVARIYRSQDDGKNWSKISDLEGITSATLFFHKDSLYLLGASSQYGDIVVRRSDDGGKTWTDSIDEDSGLLFQGGQGFNPPNYHTSPMPVLEYCSRLWRGFEDNVIARDGGMKGWPDGLHALVISADVDADLLKASSWRMTNKLPYDQNSDPPEFGDYERYQEDGMPGWLEGNAVQAPNGEVWNILRVNSVPVANKAAITKVSDDGKTLSFDPATGFMDFPGGMSKFNIKYYHEGRRYYTLSNEVFNQRNPWQRNVLVLASSDDLVHWKRECVLLYAYEDVDLVGWDCKIGFQYVEWLLDGDDLIFVSRTAYNGARNFHDGNYLTFHRLSNFRERFG
jgi:hypothetical protein